MELIEAKQIPENVLIKVQKLKALAERGVGGEAVNAKNMLDSLCSKYGITLISLEEEVKHTFSFTMKSSEQNLFFHVLLSLFGATTYIRDNMRAYDIIGKGKIRIDLPLTSAEYIEFSQLWEWHLKNFKSERRRMRKLIEKAYVYKYNLYPSKVDEDFQNEKENTPVNKTSMEDAMAIRSIANVYKDNKYHKAIEQNK